MMLLIRFCEFNETVGFYEVKGFYRDRGFLLL